MYNHLCKPSQLVRHIWGRLVTCGRLAIGPANEACQRQRPTVATLLTIPSHFTSCHAALKFAVQLLSILIPLAGVLHAQSAGLVPVISKPVSRTVELPGEIQPYLRVAVHAKVPGFVERIPVDRGTAVKEGDLIAELSAPELAAQIAEAESKVQAVTATRIEAEAQLAAAQATCERLRQAAQTPGAVAGNEVVQAQKQVDAAQALVRSREQAIHAAEAAADSLRAMRDYLKIAAPFDGVVTERLAHPGALAGPATDALVEIQQISRLRIVVAVPEEYLGGVVRGAAVSFKVPAYPDRKFSAPIARVAHALDPKTRTMPIELDMQNTDGALSPGMYPAVIWPVRSPRAALYVPKTSVVSTTERTFVIRARDGKAEWLDVKKVAAEGDLLEVSGDLKAGDRVVRRATDEIHAGSPLATGK
jgi:RND family efflux transporter MFP subunit